MKVSVEDFRRQYAGMSDDALLDVDRRELVDLARTCYEEELARRQLKIHAAGTGGPAGTGRRKRRVCGSRDVRI